MEPTGHARSGVESAWAFLQELAEGADAPIEGRARRPGAPIGRTKLPSPPRCPGNFCPDTAIWVSLSCSFAEA
jgi:hypothetical protein